MLILFRAIGIDEPLQWLHAFVQDTEDDDILHAGRTGGNVVVENMRSRMTAGGSAGEMEGTHARPQFVAAA